MPRIDREGPIHTAIISYLRIVLPSDAIVHHSANEGNRGGKRGAIDGARRKAMGVMPGFPDILVYTGGRGFCFEVKAEGAYQSDIQKAVQAQLEAQGIPYAVVRSIDDVREKLAGFGVTTRDTPKQKAARPVNATPDRA